MTVTDITFDDAIDVTSIQYRLHPLDVGFDPREDDMAIAIGDEPTLRVSYPDEQGERRVIEGPRTLVLRRLRRLGFRFQP